MTKCEAGLLTIRALAIYAVIRAIEQVGKSIQYGISDESGTIFKIFDIGQLYAPSVMLLACSISLWVIAPFLVVKIFETSSSSEESQTLSPDIKPLVFSAIGFLILIETIPELVQLFFLIFATVVFGLDNETQTHRNYIIVVTTLKIGIGIWLVLGAKGVVHAIKKLRRD